MKSKVLSSLCVTLAMCAGVSFVLISQTANRSRVAAQEPSQQPRTAEQAFKNIKIIKNMPASQLQGAMQFMSASLGVDCSHCHTRPAMEKDDKPAKQTARRMLFMVNEINKSFGDKPIVNCATCHRGQTKPSAIPPLPPLTSPLVLNVVNPTQQQLPTVDEILDRYVKALGGERALNKVTTRTRKGSVEVAGMRGTFELFEAAPNKSLLIGALPPPLGSLHQGFDGNLGWVKNENGVFDMRGDGATQARREANFYLDVRLKEQYKTMNVIGLERLAAREFYVIEGTELDGQVERLFFDVQSGLLARRSWETVTYFGQLANAIDYDDYRKIGGIRLPFLIRRVRAGMTFLQSISELKLNVKLDESIFSKPVAKKK